MKRFLFVAALLLSTFAAAQSATRQFFAEGDNLAQRLVAFAVREDVADGDWLAHAAKATGEDEKAIAAATVRAAKFFLDLTRVRASPLEPLEAVATAAKPGQTMSDVLMAYVEARKLAANKSHAEAMATLRAR